MGKKKEHQNKLLDLAREIILLGETIKEIEKHMGSIWTDEIEKADLQHLKERIKTLDERLCTLHGEIDHLEELHCKST
jgi:uncharacterized coiled-coil DUF342 family protein